MLVNRILLFMGGLLNLLPGIFKILMPHLFHWKEAMGSAEGFMWSTVYAEIFGISLLLLFFAYTSIFHWRALLETSLGKTILLSIGTLWVFRTVAELFLYRIGEDGAWWRVIMFLGAAVMYMLPLVRMAWSQSEEAKS